MAPRRKEPAATDEESGCGDAFDDLRIGEHFSMAWFAMVMGWGGLALAVNGFPGAEADFKRTLYDIGTVIWIWACVYCLAFFAFLLYRVVAHTRAFVDMMMKPGEFLFFGCVPMGLAVCGMGFVTFGPNIMRDSYAHEGALVILWIDLVLCAVSMALPPWLMITTHSYAIEKMPALWLLPFVSTVVASALAGTVGPHMESRHKELYVNVLGYCLWGMGMSVAMSIIAVYLNRLILHGLPPKAVANSVWVVLGPIGQGANAIMLLGRHTGKLQCSGYLCRGHDGFEAPEGFDRATCLCSKMPSPLEPLQSLGYAAPGVSLLIGFFLWGFGLWVYWLSATTTMYYSHLGRRVARRTGAPTPVDAGIPFHPSWWGVVFPMVTLTMATYQIHTDTEWRFFKYVGRGFAVILALTALYIHAKTIQHAFSKDFWRGFHAKK